MWTPLPEILETCLHAVYKDRGWDTSTNNNYRLDDKTDIAETFPTLTELANKVDDVIRELGYEKQISDHLRAALLTRLNGLRAGGKGRMLDVQYSLPMDALLSRPTILELQSMGDDDDKAFVMGLLLMRLYEYRHASRKKGERPPAEQEPEPAPRRLEHLMVIEEAHRLLSDVGARRSQAEGDRRGKAVETFANVLSEIRAYGQGVIIADQIPVKLAPDIIKNTNLKIVHRIVSAEDGKVLAGAMSMDEPQARALSQLATGQAAVYGQLDDAPVLVRVRKAKGIEPPDEERVRQRMSEPDIVKSKTNTFEPLLSDVDMSCPSAYRARDVARSLANESVFKREFVRLIVSMTEDDGALERLWNDLVVRGRARIATKVDEQILLRSLIAYGSAWFAYRRGSQRGWSYSETAELREKLSSVLNAKLKGEDVRAALKSFRALMHQLHSRPFEPFPGCARICTRNPPVCLYREGVSDHIAASTEDLTGKWYGAVVADKTTAGGRLRETWKATRGSADQLIEWHPAQADAIRRIRLCYAQHILSRGFLEVHQSALDGLMAEASDARNEGR
jgi:hypothetical protein